MQCPSCLAKLTPDDVRKSVCSRCNEEFLIRKWRIKLIVAGVACAGLAVYMLVTRGTDAILAFGLLGLFALLFILRARP